MAPLRRSILASLAAASPVAAILLLVPGSGARASGLDPGDVVIIALSNSPVPGALVRVDPGSGLATTLVPPGPPIVDPRELAIAGDGTVFVADASSGLLAFDPATGTISVVVPAVTLGGSGPGAVIVAPGGDVLMAGPWGVKRLTGRSGPPITVSGPGLFVNPSGMDVDVAGTIWVSDLSGGPAVPGRTGGIVAIDPVTGTQSWLDLTCSAFLFPHYPHELRVGRDGLLYVVNASGYGPTNYSNSGVFQVNPVTGVAQAWLHWFFTDGFGLLPGGDALILYGRSISRDPYDGVLVRFDGTNMFPIGNGGLPNGPMALVPADATPARPTSWGALKVRYR